MTIAATLTSSEPLSSPASSLMTAISAFRNYRAMLLLGLTFVACVLISGLCTLLAAQTGMFSFFALAWLLGFLVLFYGSNGVGILLMQDAQGAERSYGIMDAVLLSLYTSHRLLAVLILDVLIVLAVVIAIALVLLICKIPVLGPFLFTFVFPISALVLGVLVFALYCVMLPLAAPAVWAGGSVFQVIARINMVIRRQLIQVLLSELLLFLITAFAASIISSIVFLGSTMTSTMSAMMIGMGGDWTAMLSGFGMGGASGHLIAAAIGGSLLFAVAAVIPSLIWTKGLCLIYLNTTRDLDFSSAESALNQTFEGARKKAEAARERARELAARQQAESAVRSDAPLSASAEQTCPACHVAITEEDVFCGSCGHKLK